MGKKAITWDATNNAKLLNAIMSIHKFKVNYEAVAKCFGPEVPKRCIESQIYNIRKSVGSGTGRQATSTKSASTGTVAQTSTTKQSGSHKRKRGKKTSDDESDAASDGSTSSDEENTTPTTLTSAHRHAKMTGPRSTPRKLVKKDYGKLNDSGALALTDEEGHDCFSSGTEAGDDDADGDFGEEADRVVKKEEYDMMNDDDALV